MAKSRPSNDISWIESILGNEAESLLYHECKSIDKKMVITPGKDFGKGFDKAVGIKKSNKNIKKKWKKTFG